MANETPQQNPSVETTPSRSDQDSLLFFNVMPKPKTTGSLVSPTFAATQSNENVPDTGQDTAVSQGVQFLNTYKNYIFIILGVIVLLGAGYYAYAKYSANKSTSKPLSTSQTNNTQSQLAVVGKISTPKEWQKKYFSNEVCANADVCGDSADPDYDGLTNAEEFKANTDPNNNDSDGDGISDGDEVLVFLSNPLNKYTANNNSYSDGDYLKNGYDLKSNDTKFSATQFAEINSRMKHYGLHKPTIVTLGSALTTLYNFSDDTESSPVNATTTVPTSTISTLPSASSTKNTLDQSAAAKQDRDTERSNTIKNLGILLIKYKDDHGTFLATTNFQEMVTAVKPYARVGIDSLDPINSDPYIYTYTSDGKDFTLTFYSETQSQIIKKHSADALKDKNATEATNFDSQRQDDLEMIRSALLLYSNKNIAGNQDYVFPTELKYKTELVPNYISSIPKDPKTNLDYEYKVSATFDTFTLKAILSNPPAGTTGYVCNQDDCRNY